MADRMAVARTAGRSSRVVRAGIAVLVPSVCGVAGATGGHHGVEDASILDPGQCQLETWYERAGPRALGHVGPACRVGPVEAGLNLEQFDAPAQARLRSAGVQLKAATDLDAAWSIGAVWSAADQNRAPHATGHSLVGALTWQVDPHWTLHANLGRDWRRLAPDGTRRGFAVEWQPGRRWQWSAEWVADGLHIRRRAAARYFASDRLSLDLSGAADTGRPRGASWTAGINWVFDR